MPRNSVEIAERTDPKRSLRHIKITFNMPDQGNQYNWNE